MPSTLVGSTMAKKKAKTATARLDEELIRMANVISALRNVSAPDYLNGLLRPLIERDYTSELAKATKDAGGKGAAK